MRNTQGSGSWMVPCWLKFLNANEQKHVSFWEILDCGKKNYLIKSVYIFQECLNFRVEWKSENVLHQGRGYNFAFTGNKELWIPSKLINKDQIWSGETTRKSWLQTWRKRPGKTTRQVACELTPDMGTAQRLSETGQILTTESSWFITCHPFIRMAAKLYYSLLIQSKQTCKVDRCLLPDQTQNKNLSLVDLYTLHIPYLC